MSCSKKKRRVTSKDAYIHLMKKHELHTCKTILSLTKIMEHIFVLVPTSVGYDTFISLVI